jgi:pre-mRNA-splicing factor ATP-dependent RNA helicase DHX15/PRP43
MTARDNPRDNPYLAHLPPSQRGAGVSIDPTAKEPLYGFMPRKVTGAQVLKAMVCFKSYVQT